MINSLGHNTFSSDDLKWFANASGDYNPIHLDPVIARRLINGKQTVHGIFVMLFALDRYYQKHAHVPKQIKTYFQKPILEGEEVKFSFESQKNETCILVYDNYEQLASIRLIGFGNPIYKSIINRRPIKQQIINNTFKELKNLSGKESIMALKEDIDLYFTNTSRILGDYVVASLMSFSRIVGMSAPGLHSIFTALNLKLEEPKNLKLSWSVNRHFSPSIPIQIQVKSYGLCAELDAFMRPSPVMQPTMSDVQAKIDPYLFIGQRAIIIGGSRGLGEIVAKCVSAGGGNVLITYMNGKNDAIAIKNDINKNGGYCESLKLDVMKLNGLKDLLNKYNPTHIYYFATTHIKKNFMGYNSAQYNTFSSIYIGAFTKLVKLAIRYNFHSINFFYPSTVFIDKTPKGFEEYAEAKKNGEIQCQILKKENTNLNIFIKRLPVLNTDQTNSLKKLDAKSSLEEMKKVVIKMHKFIK